MVSEVTSNSSTSFHPSINLALWDYNYRLWKLIFIFSAGRVAEFDTPTRLLEDKSSMFLKLVTEYSSRSSGMPDF